MKINYRFLSILFFLVYFLVSFFLNSNFFQPTPFSYYNALIASLMKGKVNLESTITTYDLSFYKGRWYMYWGPAPVLFIFPFYLLGGFFRSDRVYTLIGGLLNIFVFYLLMKEFIKFFKLKVKDIHQKTLIISFALASPNFFLSIRSGVWFTNQVIAMFYLLFSYLFFFLYLRKKQLKYFTVSVLFFNLAWLSRYLLFLNVMFFVYLIIKEKANLKKLSLVFVFLTSLAFAIFFANNYLKFGNIFETGASYQIGNPYFNEKIRKGEFFKFSYFFDNLYYYFLNPLTFTSQFPYVSTDLMGNSVFIVYPLTLLGLSGLIRKIKSSDELLILTVKLFVVIYLGILMLYMATGFAQFGNRYFFDVIPWWFLFSLFSIKKIGKMGVLFLIIFGFLVNLLGIISFYQMLPQ